MTTLPELNDDAVIDVAREGGVAFIPTLSGPRRFALGELSDEEKARVCHIMKQALALGQPPGAQSQVGRGDQRYFRIEITYATSRQAGNIVLVIPENLAPPALVELWKNGQ